MEELSFRQFCRRFWHIDPETLRQLWVFHFDHMIDMMHMDVCAMEAQIQRLQNLRDEVHGGETH